VTEACTLKSGSKVSKCSLEAKRGGDIRNIQSGGVGKKKLSNGIPWWVVAAPVATGWKKLTRNAKWLNIRN